MKIGDKEYSLGSLSIKQTRGSGEAILLLAGKSKDGAREEVEFGYEDWKYFMDLATLQKVRIAIGPETHIPDWWRWIDEIGMQAGFAPRYMLETKGRFPEDAEPNPGPHFNCAGDVVVPKEEEPSPGSTIDFLGHLKSLELKEEQ